MMQMTIKQAQAYRAAMVQASASLDDRVGSTAPGMFPQLNGDGSLVKAGTRINWGGILKRATSDLWDTAQNTPEANPNGWEDISYRDGLRIIPDVITPGTAFALGEAGWWGDAVYVSKREANVHTPDQAPDQWERRE